MSKKYYRFFGGLLTTQEKWLNKMSDKGYRLIGTGKLLYEFAECQPGQFRYCIEFIGEKSMKSAASYRAFLEDMGYRVFYKNINLNLSVGKVRVRPWAEQGGRISTNRTTYNRELLIVEMERDLSAEKDLSLEEGKPFDLHTSYEDKLDYLRTLRSPYLFLFIVPAILSILQQAFLWAIFAGISLVPLTLYQIEIFRLKKLSKLKEW